jgi:hypothetical protein
MSARFCLEDRSFWHSHGVKEIIKFEDDEDVQNRTHRTAVPSRYVTVPADYFYDDADDVDLTPENKY